MVAKHQTKKEAPKMSEYIIWGITPSATHEEPLYTKARTKRQAEHIKNIIERNFKATECRIQTLDINTPPDFKGAIQV